MKDNLPRSCKIVKLYNATADKRGFFESVLGFMQMADQWFRVSAADQKRYFGKVVFGKCAIKVSETGVITIFKVKAYGRDFETLEFILDSMTGTFRSTFDLSEVTQPARI